MKLALRRSHAADATVDQKVFAALTKWVLKTKYPHSGIVIGDVLYHANLSKGLHATAFTPAKWELYEVGGDDAKVLALFHSLRGARYDWLSLLSFLLPIKVRVSDWLYCYEWSWLAMTGERAKAPVTPEELLATALARGVCTRL